MKVDMKTSKAYRRVLELMDKYPDEDFTDVSAAIIAHTMIYMTISRSTPLSREKDFEAIKAYYTPTKDGLQLKHPSIVKIGMLNKLLPVEVETIENKEKN